jgi:dihydroorotate dehydrogenase
LHQDILGVEFPNPVGLAAGMDKNAIALSTLEQFGFGSLEFGGVTPQPQKGNPKPRLFNVWEKSALINRMGFNSDGVEQVVQNLMSLPRPSVPIGANLAVNKERAHDPEQVCADYVASMEALYYSVDYFVVNVSSLNTPGLRDQVAHLPGMLAYVHAQNVICADLWGVTPKPIFVKLSGDMQQCEFETAVNAISCYPNGGLVAINASSSRDGVRARHVPQGALSGPPIFKRMLHHVRIARACAPDMVIVASGGISNAQDAIEALHAGANVCQVYTSFVVQDPFVASHINAGVCRYMHHERMSNIIDFQSYWT